MQTHLTDARTDSAPGRQLASRGGHPLPSNCSPNSAGRVRPPIDPEVAELVAELAARFRSNASPAEEKLTLRLLMEDLSRLIDAEALAAAIDAGVATWRFMPKAAEIIDAAAPFLADRRERAREARLRREAAERLALPAPGPADAAERETVSRLLSDLAKQMRVSNPNRPAMTRATPDAADAGQRASRLETPATSDLSPAMRARLASQQPGQGDAP